MSKKINTTNAALEAGQNWAQVWLKQNGYRNAVWALLALRSHKIPKRVRAYAAKISAQFVAGEIGMDDVIFAPDQPHHDELSGYTIA